MVKSWRLPMPPYTLPRYPLRWNCEKGRHMMEPLNEAQQYWVATTFETLSTEAKVTQLLIPNTAE